MKKEYVIPFWFAGMLSLAGMLTSNAAIAQKSKDTLRIGLGEQVGLMSIIWNARPEVGLFALDVHDQLFSYDAANGKFEGLLAKSWKQVNPTTLEIELKKGITFHDGSEFDADDVVYTFNWMADPKVRFRFKTSYNWMKVVEKIDKYNVRIISKKPFGAAMARLAVTIVVYPSHIHQKLKVKSDFAKLPIGTGRYKVIYNDRSKGIKVVKNPNYKHGNSVKPAASIGTIIGIPLPDKQSQLAQLMVGGIDLMHQVPKSLADEMGKDPRFNITAMSGISYFYMGLDSIGRSGVEALKNIKVREALMRAIDRKLLIKSLIPGGDPSSHAIPALCLRVQAGCDFSSQPPSFDRSKAKQLLAEAGYANGFDVKINSFPGAYQIAEAVGGQLSKIGIRAKIRKLTFGAYRKAQKKGDQPILVAWWTSGGLPDVSSTMNYWFSKTGRDYWQDDMMDGFRKEGDGTIDPVKRRAIFKKAFDRINEKRWIMPIAIKPAVMLHTKDVSIRRVPTPPPIGYKLGDLSWN